MPPGFSSPAAHADPERTALLFDGMSQGVLFVDAEAVIVLANPAAERILGLTAVELQGRTADDVRWEAVHEDGSPFPGPEHPSSVALRTGQPVRQVVMGVRNPRTREQRWLRIDAVPRFRASESRPFEVFTTFEDITELKRLELALRHSQERFRVAAECSNDVLYEWHLVSGEVEYFGGRHRELPNGGRAPASHWVDRLHPEEREGIQAEVQARLRDAQPFRQEHRLLGEDGQWMHVVTRGQAVLDADGRPVRWIGASSDVTNERLAEAKLRQTLNLFEAVVEGISDPVFIRNTSGHYLMVNAAGAARLRRPVSEIIGRTNFDLLPRGMAESMHATDQQVISTAAPVTYESEGPGAGKYFTTKMPYRNHAGEIVGIIGIARNVTELKRLEAEFRQAQKMEAVGRLAGGVAHDFNNLLTIILGCVDELQALGHQPHEVCLGEIKAASERAAQLTKQLLAFSRRQVLQPQPTDINALIANLERLLVRVLGEPIKLRTLLAHDTGTVRVDPHQFEQVILNLAVNARDAMPRGGRLTIASHNHDITDGEVASERGVARGRYVMVTVSDNGQGIDPDVVPRIFEPFFTTKERAGTGLGLSTVYGTVKQSGGDVWVHSEPGIGTTFKIILPRIEDPVAAPAQGGSTEPARGEGVVLLVEDEERLRGLLRTVLERHGYTVHQCGDVPEARDWLSRHDGPLDLILSDMVMPNGTGLDLERAARQARPELPVLFMSGYAEHTVTDLGALPQGTYFIQKPFTPRTLALRLREILKH